MRSATTYACALLLGALLGALAGLQLLAPLVWHRMRPSSGQQQPPAVSPPHVEAITDALLSTEAIDDAQMAAVPAATAAAAPPLAATIVPAAAHAASPVPDPLVDRASRWEHHMLAVLRGAQQDAEPIANQRPMPCAMRQASVLSQLRHSAGLQRDLADAHVLQRAICGWQFPPAMEAELADPRAIYYADFNSLSGMGSHVMRLVMALLRALSADRVLIHLSDGRWQFADARECPERNSDCYFQTLGNFTKLPWSRLEHLSRQQDLALTAGTDRTLDPFQRRVVARSVEYRVAEHSAELQTWGAEHTWLPHRTICWIAAQALYYLAQPTAKLDKFVREQMRQSGFQAIVDSNASCACLHVRHGDKTREANVYPLQQYMVLMKHAFPDVRNVWLMTDDPQVIRDAARDYPDYRFMYTNMERRNGSAARDILRRQVSGRTEAFFALVDAFIGADCDYFVGTMSSTLGRLVYMLHYGKYGCPPAHAGLDDWRRGFAACSRRHFLADLALQQRSPRCGRIPLVRRGP